MRNTRQGLAALEGGDNVTMQQLMETMRALKQVVATSKVDQDHFQVDLVASQASNKELRKTNEELHRSLQDVGERTVDE